MAGDGYNVSVLELRAIANRITDELHEKGHQLQGTDAATVTVALVGAAIAERLEVIEDRLLTIAMAK